VQTSVEEVYADQESVIIEITPAAQGAARAQFRCGSDEVSWVLGR
jgi:hypothetical protein